MQLLSNETGLEIHVSHFPPGTSKWNQIEHHLFSHISKNWRGRPLVSLAVIISLIGSTTTKKGLRVRCGIDTNEYEKGMRATMTFLPCNHHIYPDDCSEDFITFG
ncbi:MAG TPA: hypothetical protein DD633_08795 [Sphaerochaeta sp.]|nr:hypothetical protein [Sphaerochaeta sp.]